MQANQQQREKNCQKPPTISSPTQKPACSLWLTHFAPLCIVEYLTCAVDNRLRQKTLTLQYVHPPVLTCQRVANLNDRRLCTALRSPLFKAGPGNILVHRPPFQAGPLDIYRAATAVVRQRQHTGKFASRPSCPLAWLKNKRLQE